MLKLLTDLYLSVRAGESIVLAPSSQSGDSLLLVFRIFFRHLPVSSLPYTAIPPYRNQLKLWLFHQVSGEKSEMCMDIKPLFPLALISALDRGVLYGIAIYVIEFYAVLAYVRCCVDAHARRRANTHWNTSTNRVWACIHFYLFSHL